MNEKNTILSPFDLCNKLFGPYMFSHTNRQTLTEKMELYFQDFSFVPLFMQVRLCVHRTSGAVLTSLAHRTTTRSRISRAPTTSTATKPH